jgi:hypothetical protein
VAFSYGKITTLLAENASAPTCVIEQLANLRGRSAAKGKDSAAAKNEMEDALPLMEPT